MDLVIMICAALVVLATAERHIIQLTPEFIAKVEPVIKKCKAETNAPDDVFEQIMMGNLEDESNLMFTYCYMITKELLTTDGRFNISKMLSYIKEENLKEEYKKFLLECNKVTGKDRLEVIKNLAECYKEKSPVVYSLKCDGANCIKI